MNNDIVIFKNGELELEVSVSKDRETVWLSQKQMSQLFKVSTDNVGLHIKNILDEQELDSSTAEESSLVGATVEDFSIVAILSASSIWSPARLLARLRMIPTAASHSLGESESTAGIMSTPSGLRLYCSASLS